MVHYDSLEAPQCLFLVPVRCGIVVSLDKSRGYYAFVIVMPPPHKFLVCALQPTVLIQSFSNLGHMSLAPRSRRQSILGALRFHLWPLGGQMRFSCGHSRDLSFQPIFFIFAPNMHWTKIQTPIDFRHPAVPFVATRGPNSFVSCIHCKPQSFQWIFFKFTPNIPQTKANMPRNFQHSAVPFLATRGPS